MTIELSLIMILGILLLVQQGFYMWQLNKLQNKLMSRNYVEYMQTNSAYAQPMNRVTKVELPDDFEAQRLRDLNSLTGIMPL